jgi:Na+-transporting NADH:ubiquinone oxidoreductase subunit C
MSLKDKSWYPVAYMFTLTAFFSLILIGFARLTQGRVEVNEKLAFESAALKALPLGLSGEATDEQIHQLFTKRVRELQKIDVLEEQELEVCGLLPESKADATLAGNLKTALSQVEAVGIVIKGQGFWDRVEGVIGVRFDQQDKLWKITGIAFYRQRETPGLGAEITTPRFTKQFREGKVISRNPPPLRFVTEEAKAGASEINQITGATQTSTRVEGIINDHLARWMRAVNKTVK